MKNIRGIERKTGKKGSYIVEAAMALPLLILCVVALALIVKIIAVCESITFVTAAEVHKMDVNAYSKTVPASVEIMRLKKAVSDENPSLGNFRIKNFDYLFSKSDIDDLIAVDCTAKFKVANPVGIKGRIDFESSLMSRGFTGTLQDAEPLSRSRFTDSERSHKVVVFPRYGIRYHDLDCWYVHKEYAGEEYKIEMEKADSKAKGYTPCKVCNGGGK